MTSPVPCERCSCVTSPERAGPQWGGGYVDPREAADELLAEVVEPYLDDLDRRARRQARGAATEIGLGLLRGLYSGRDEDEAERVLPMRACRTPSTTSPSR